MKKILIILSLFLALTMTQEFSIDDIVNKTSKIWQEEESVKIPDLSVTDLDGNVHNEEKSVKIPDFSVTDLDGNVHNNESIKGKYLVVNFWATWCPPCLKEIPAFVEFYEEHSDKVQILGLDYEQANKTKIVEFTDTYMVNYPIILFDDINAKEFKKFGEVIGMPTTYIYSPEGRLIDFRMGEMNITDLEKAIL